MKRLANIISTIFGARAVAPAPTTTAAAAAAPEPASAPAPASPPEPASGAESEAVAETPLQAPPSPAAQPATAPTPIPETVDVAAILDGLAAKHPEKLDWKKSIVDLMKLVGMDSGLAARKELAAELGYSGDAADTAKMNVWLHRQVLQKLAENGGRVPAELLD